MKSKYIVSLIILVLLTVIIPAYASSSKINDEELKNKAYDTIADALFDEKIHYNMKIEIFNILNNIAAGENDEDQSPDLMEDFYKNIITNPAKSTLTIDIFSNEEEKPEDTDKTPAPLDKKVIEILQKTIKSDNDNILLYGLDSISMDKVKVLEPEVLETLKNFDRDDPEIETTLISTLGKIGNDSTIEFLQPYLKDENLRIKLNALQAIADINSEKSKQILEEQLNSDSLELALFSAGVLADEKDEKAIKLLEEGIESPVLLTQQKTLIAMSNIKDPGILPVIKKAVKLDNDIVQAYALNILSRIDSPESVKIISKFTDDQKLMPRALVALGKNSSNEAYKIFEDIIKSDNKSQKTYAIAVLTRIKNKKIIPILKIALNDPNENVQIAAAKILHTLKDDSGIDTLIKATKSDNEDVALSAAAFLGYMGNKSGLSILKNAVFNTDLPSWKRLDISIILENLGDTSTLSTLKTLLSQQRPSTLPKDLAPTEKTLLSFIKEDSPWLQLNSCIFLSRKDNKDCIKTLENLANNPDLKVRSFAVSLLGKSGSKDVLPTLQKHLTDDSVRVRVESAESIIKILSEKTKPVKKENNQKDS